MSPLHLNNGIVSFGLMRLQSLVANMAVGGLLDSQVNNSLLLASDVANKRKAECSGDLSPEEGARLVWDPAWGKINSETYRTYILPLVSTWMDANPDHILMQDNAPAHRARATKGWLQEEFK
jgi:hypothetical protein